ncbi:Aste57867_10237 [Aphanomyces stellatus]|uniref:Peroxisomal ATPase PEX1 n=1 Tax=Aphanomyces stellatus TaxID=120398 RepID=A0A485KPU5_9STRA|nr:hypothetical protein As57867_010198 [Aphanomyces stellatus]VFT87112.1 Aste57867_10237 [Aphanomyces stellatus]
MHAPNDAAAFLPARLLPTCSCFVSLPESFVRAYLSHVNSNFGATILRLTWQSGSDVEIAHVGWVGDIAQSEDIEISMEFARCLRLADAMEASPGMRVNVSLAPFTPVAQSVEMEPCTSDDWEIIQLHAGYLENEILRQICVVQHNQEIPIRIQQHIVVHLIAILPPDTPFARLSSNSEIAIAPKERQTGLVPDTSSFDVSPPLTLQPLTVFRADGSTVTLAPEDDEILVHPSTYALLDGTTANADDETSFLCASVWPDDVDTAPTTARRVAVGRLRCVPTADVVCDYVGVSTAMQAALGVESLDRVRLRILKQPPLLPLRIILIADAPSPDDVIDLFLEWTDACSARVLTPKNRVTLDDGSHLVVHVVFHNTDIPSSADNTNSSTTQPSDNDYVILGDDYRPTRDVVTVQPPPLSPSTATKGAISDVTAPASLASLPGMEPILDAMWKLVFPSIGREACAVRTRLGVGPPGSIILHGPRGAGKSSLVRALETKCKWTFGTMCHTVRVTCRDLRGMKMDTVKGELTAAFDRAHACAPCLLVLDDIDALMPPESDESGLSDQSRRLAEHVAELLKQVKHRMHAHITQLAQTDNAANWPLFAAACTKKSIVIVATAREAQSMHPLLRSCGLLDRPIAIPLPDVFAREKILLGLVASKSTTAPTTGHDDIVPTTSLHEQVHLAAYKTEGFSVRDLTQVVDRAVHQSSIRARQTNVRSMDLMAGLEGFTPAALRGVELFKSTVEWGDIGGLTDIRQMLKDTLELPTKYGKLYSAAPIKLPSGLLLYGPPGCGKTLLANAVAHECGLNFISVKGPEVLNKYIGASEQAVRDLFGRAAAAAPSVLFLDEFDAMAPRRGADNTGVTDRVVNQLLTFLDGVEARQGVYVLAATSRPDMIDPALLRPGRLDKSLYCGYPDAAERLDILHAVSRKMDLADDVPALLKIVAMQTELYSGADLQAILYSAQLEAVHESIPSTAAEDWDVDFQDSSDSVSFSPKKTTTTKITSRHLQKAVADSRPSVSLEAKQRYDRMYGSFKNTSQPRVTDFKTADSDVGFDAAHQTQRSALY